MELAELKTAVERLAQAGGTVSMVPAHGGALLTEVEQTLRLECPEQVRLFYSDFEYLQLGAVEFVWIRDMIETVRRDRARHRHVPIHFLPVLPDELGGYYYVVCRRRDQATPPDFGQIIYNPGGHPGTYEVAAEDFLEFVVRVAEAELTSFN